MKTKQFNHNEIEKCKLSKKDIDIEKDNYSVIVDCIGDSINSVGFYKTEVLKDLIDGKAKEVKKSFIGEYKKQLNEMLSGLNLPQQQKEVFEIA